MRRICTFVASLPDYHWNEKRISGFQVRVTDNDNKKNNAKLGTGSAV